MHFQRHLLSWWCDASLKFNYKQMGGGRSSFCVRNRNHGIAGLGSRSKPTPEQWRDEQWRVYTCHIKYNRCVPYRPTDGPYQVSLYECVVSAEHGRVVSGEWRDDDRPPSGGGVQRGGGGLSCHQIYSLNTARTRVTWITCEEHLSCYHPSLRIIKSLYEPTLHSNNVVSL